MSAAGGGRAPLSETTRNDLLRAIQAGVPFVPRPFAALGGSLGLGEDEILACLRDLRKQGILRTTMINQIIAVGCLMGVSPRLLARLYRDHPNS